MEWLAGWDGVGDGRGRRHAKLNYGHKGTDGPCCHFDDDNDKGGGGGGGQLIPIQARRQNRILHNAKPD